jgi:micrococcal nuclease
MRRVCTRNTLRAALLLFSCVFCAVIPAAGEKPELVPAQVLRVVDGDTIKVRADGFEGAVRLIGVNTPETKHPSKGVEPYGPEAAAYTKKILDGRRVFLEFDAQRLDRYRRVLAYVWLSEPKDDSPQEVQKRMFNAHLLFDGYAQVMSIPPNVKYQDVFLALQREAREANRGLWGLQGGAQQKEKKTEVSSATYIGNVKSKVFHLPTCNTLPKEANRVYFATREEALAAGYRPCKRCKP